MQGFERCGALGPSACSSGAGSERESLNGEILDLSFEDRVLRHAPSLEAKVVSVTLDSGPLAHVLLSVSEPSCSYLPTALGQLSRSGGEVFLCWAGGPQSREGQAGKRSWIPHQPPLGLQECTDADSTLRPAARRTLLLCN